MRTRALVQNIGWLAVAGVAVGVAAARRRSERSGPRKERSAGLVPQLKPSSSAGHPLNELADDPGEPRERSYGAIGRAAVFPLTLAVVCYALLVPSISPSHLVIATMLLALCVIALLYRWRLRACQEFVSGDITLVITDPRSAAFWERLLRFKLPPSRRAIRSLYRPVGPGQGAASARFATELFRNTLDDYAVRGLAVRQVVLIDPTPEDAVIRRTCEERGIEVCDICFESSVAATVLPDLPVVTCKLPLWKRMIDIVVSAVLLVVLAPVLLIVAGIVYLDLGWPALFSQRRVGAGGRGFVLYKFRTLRAPFDEAGRRLSNAERLSPIGDLLRRSHLDELPQLINVLLGDMSLIGPRPLLPNDQPPGRPWRLAVRPGVTGIAQLAGGQALTSDEKADFDEAYIQSLSFTNDMRILFGTAILLMRGGSRDEWVGDAALRSPSEVKFQ